jgi:outer membrane protein OmpA-like peptidoglycan-associated protein
MPVAMTPVADIAAIRVTFAFNSNALTPESVPALKALGEALKSNELASSCIQIEGHTDSKGSDAYNRQLSRRRAQSVIQYLVQELGVPQDRLIPVGKGESEPIADNSIDAGRQKNRRVQIVNLGYPKTITLEGR